MPVQVIAETTPLVHDWSPAGAALRSSKPRWVREMAWTPLVPPPSHGGHSSRAATPTAAAAVEAPKAKKTASRPSAWATSTGRGAHSTEKDGPCVGQYHVAHDCVLPRAPAMKICERVGGSRLPPDESQSARPSSAPNHNHEEEDIPERIVESIRGHSPCVDFGRSTPRPDKLGNRESYWEVTEEKDVSKLSTKRTSVGHRFGKAPRNARKVQEGGSWPPNISYKHCSNEHKSQGTVAFAKQSPRFTDVQIADPSKAGSRFTVKGFWDKVTSGMRHERYATHDDDHVIKRRPQSVMDMSKTTGRTLLTPEPKDYASGRQSTSPEPDAFRSGRMSSFQDPGSSVVPHLPEDPPKASQTWHQFTGRAPSPKGASRSAKPGGRKAASAKRDNKGFSHEWALEECRRITEWFEWRHGKNQEQGQELDAQGMPAPRRFL